MKAISQKIAMPTNKAFEIRKDVLPHFYNSWHFHTEIELTLILKSKGRRFIGDHIDQFDIGDLVLIGSNLPHLWQNDDRYYQGDSSLSAEAIILHFSEKFRESDFFDLQELEAVNELLKKAKYGIKIEGKYKNIVSKKIKALLSLKGFERLILFFEILNSIAAHCKTQLLASSGFVNSFKVENDPRLDKIYEYVMEHLTERIELSKVAALVNLSNSAFCRFFKSKTRKTFSSFVNEVRIGYACRLLQNDCLSISQICYDCGFESFTYFSRSFKQITNKTPSLYRKEFNFNI